ncbi:hypothetical protein MACJ_002661 [Theileria orientalis]|uniref:Uncharacterized protein n=1 Tax=Theileria orientalis TaxID=68886 RepID=A0A976M6L6_THEOR|nr:hypothetical protein MACJ_002661 [Theileria orientalis]
MRLISQLNFITYITARSRRPLIDNVYDNGPFNSMNGQFENIHIGYSKMNNNIESLDDYFKEENYKNLPPELQLEQLNKDKQMYNNLKRIIRKSKKYEMPQTEVVSEVVYPPPSADTTHNSGQLETKINSIREMYDRNYEPVRTQLNSNTTLELVSSIIQQPVPSDDIDIKDTDSTRSNSIDGDDTGSNSHTTIDGRSGSNKDGPRSSFNLKKEQYFKIKDYTENEPIHENEIYLKEINESLTKRKKPPITVDDTGSSGSDELTFATSDDSGLDTTDKLDKFERLNSNKRFLRELRRLKLEKATKYRKFLSYMRDIREKNQNSYYHQLPVNEKGYREYTIEDIAKFSYEEMQEELRNRGYRCSYEKEDLEQLLRVALKEDDEWRYENIVKQELSADNMNLPEASRNKLKKLNEKVEMLNETAEVDDMSIRIKRLENMMDLMEFHTDPVGYLNLDVRDEELDESEIERIKNAPTIYDTTFVKEMARPITRLPDLIPRTFNLQEDYVHPFPITSMRSDRELEDLKREYLTIEGGIHQQTLPEISKRFQVSVDFLGDACCRLGAHAPIDLTRELRGIISYSAIWDLLQFLNICDGAEIELFYPRINLKQVACELKVELDKVYECLNKLKIKAPFGDDTRLNLTCLKSLEYHINKM